MLTVGYDKQGYKYYKMQGVKGGGDAPSPPKPETSELSKQMRKAGRDRAQAEDWQKQAGMAEKIQANISHIKDKAAEQMDKLGAATKNIVK